MHALQPTPGDDVFAVNLALVFPGCHRRGGVERLVFEAGRHYARSHDVTVYAQECEDDGLERVTIRRIPIRGLKVLRLLTFSRDVRHALDGAVHDHVVSFGAT